MIRRIRRACCLLLAVLLLPGMALAGSIDELIAWLTQPGEQAVEVALQAEAVRVPELSETRTEWLNGLLKHLTFRLRTDGEIQEEIIAVDGADALGCMSRGGTEYAFSFEPEKAYRMPDGSDLLAALSGISADTDGMDFYSRIPVLMNGFYTFFSGLPELFPEEAKVSKVNIRYKPYGTAVQKWTMSLPEDVLQTEKMIAYLAGDNMADIREYFSGTVLSGRQRLTLLTDENGRLMKVNYTGKAGLSADDIRSVNLDWRCPRGENGYRDVLQLTTPAVQGTQRDNLSVTQEMATGEDGQEEYSGTIERDLVYNRVRTRIVTTFALTAKEQHIAGTAEEKTIIGGSKETTEVQAELTQEGKNEYRGSLEIAHKLDKIEKEHYRFRISAAPCDPLRWNAGTAGALTEAGQAGITEKAARVFLEALKNLPEADLQYILADLPEGTWDRITGNQE